MSNAESVPRSNRICVPSGENCAEKIEDVPSALRAWEQSERPVTDATQRYSRIYGKIGVTWTKHLLDLRSSLVGLIGRSRYVQRRVNVAAHHFPRIGAAPERPGSGKATVSR